MLQRHLPFVDVFSSEAQDAARQAATLRDTAADDRIARQDKLLSGATETARRAMADVLGPKALIELRLRMRAELLNWRDLLQPPGGLKIDYAATNLARRTKVNRLLKKLGVDIAKLRAIGLEFQAAVDALPDAGGFVRPGFHLGHNLKTWLELSPLHVKALPWGPQPTHE